MDQKVMKDMSDVTEGGCYERLPDGTIVRIENEAAAAAAPADGGPGSAVGTANGDSPTPPEDDDA